MNLASDGVVVVSEPLHGRTVAASVDSLRRLLEGQSSYDVSGVIQILDALSARTSAEYHKRVRRLPVVVTSSRSLVGAGRRGVNKTFTHRSGHKRTFFIADDLVPAHQPSAESLSTNDAAAPGGERESVEPESVLVTQSSSYCEYTDPEDVYYSGECATQQEIEDAQILYVAMEAEALYAEAEGNAALEFDEYCSSFIIPPPECPQGGPDTADDAADALLLEGVETGLEVVVSVAPTISCVRDCTSQGIAFGAAVANWGFRSWKIAAALTAIQPVAGALSQALILGGVALGTATATMIALRNCVGG